MYVILAEVVLYREVSLKDLPKVMVQSMVMVGGILRYSVSPLRSQFFGGCRGTPTARMADLYEAAGFVTA